MIFYCFCPHCDPLTNNVCCHIDLDSVVINCKCTSWWNCQHVAFADCRKQSVASTLSCSCFRWSLVKRDSTLNRLCEKMSRSPLLMESLPQSHNSLRGSGGNFTARVISATDQIEPIPDNVHDGRRRAFPVCSWETTWMNVKEKHSIILSGFTQVIALLMGRGGGTRGVRHGRLEVCLIWRDSFWWVKLTFPLCGDGEGGRNKLLLVGWGQRGNLMRENYTSALVLGQKNVPKTIILQLKGCFKLERSAECSPLWRSAYMRVFAYVLYDVQPAVTHMRRSEVFIARLDYGKRGNIPLVLGANQPVCPTKLDD